MVFAAVGMICGMFFTNMTLEEQTFGDRLEDKEFRQYMNIENPEIVNHLPLAFLLTSCGDTFNNYSFRFHKALKSAGRTSRLVIFDILLTLLSWEEIKAVKEQLGLRHVILMHSLMGGLVAGPAELVCDEFNYHTLRRLPDTVFIGDLFEKFADTPIRYDKSRGGNTAFWAHASGTREMLPITDKAFNSAINAIPNEIRERRNGTEEGRQLSHILTFDLSDAYGLATGIIGPLARGEKIVMTFFGYMHPKFMKAIEYYRVKAMYFILLSG